MTQHHRNLPSHLRQKVDAELEFREKILWIDRPIPWFWTAASRRSFFTGIFFTPFSLFWVRTAIDVELPDLREGLSPEAWLTLTPLLFALSFLLTGLGMLSAPLWTWLQTRNTVYVITDKRAFSCQGIVNVTIRNFYPQRMADIFRRDRPNGLGDLVLNVRRWRDQDGVQNSEEQGFFNISNPQAAELLIRRLMQGAN